MNKYRNKPVVIDNIRFSSQREARRYCELKLLEKFGKITDLVLQPRFPIVVNEQKVCTYVADYAYREVLQPNVHGPVIIEDAKGVRTDIYKLKKRLMKAVHSIDIIEV